MQIFGFSIALFIPRTTARTDNERLELYGFLISDAGTGNNSGLAYVEVKAVGKKGFEHGVSPANELQSWWDWLSGKSNRFQKKDKL